MRVPQSIETGIEGTDKTVEFFVCRGGFPVAMEESFVLAESFSRRNGRDARSMFRWEFRVRRTVTRDFR